MYDGKAISSKPNSAAAEAHLTSDTWVRYLGYLGNYGWALLSSVEGHGEAIGARKSWPCFVYPPWLQSATTTRTTRFRCPRMTRDPQRVYITPSAISCSVAPSKSIAGQFAWNAQSLIMLPLALYRRTRPGVEDLMPAGVPFPSPQLQGQQLPRCRLLLPGKGRSIHDINDLDGLFGHEFVVTRVLRCFWWASWASLLSEDGCSQ